MIAAPCARLRQLPGSYRLRALSAVESHRRHRQIPADIWTINKAGNYLPRFFLIR
nr:MAG TPA: hypothetical protein [Caudoviricetes sp.]